MTRERYRGGGPPAIGPRSNILLAPLRPRLGSVTEALILRERPLVLRRWRLDTSLIGPQVRRLGAALALLLAVASVPAAADTACPPSEQPAAVGDGRRTMGRLPANLGRTGSASSTRRTWCRCWWGEPLPGSRRSGTTTCAARYSRTFTWGRHSRQPGSGVQLAVRGRHVRRGALRPGRRFRAMTYDMLDSAIVNFTYTEVLKVAVGRERPNGQDNYPSLRSHLERLRHGGGRARGTTVGSSAFPHMRWPASSAPRGCTRTSTG